MSSMVSAEVIPWACRAAVMDDLVTAPAERESRAVLSAADMRPAALVVAVVDGIVMVRSVVPVTWPVESEVICETVKVPPKVGVAFAVGFQVLDV